MKEFKSIPEKKAKSPFIVPENYFETLSDRIVARVEDKQEVKVIPLYLQLKYQILASAAVILLFFGIFWMTQKKETSGFDDDQIEYYLSYKQHLNTYDLISLMEDDLYLIESEKEASELEIFLLKNNDIELLMEIESQP